MQENSLKNIIGSALSGNQASLTKLINLVSDKIFNIALYFHGEYSLAQDASQDILIQVIQKLNTLKNPDKFENWAYTIASNKLRNTLRDSKRFKGLSFEAMEADSKSHLELSDTQNEDIENIKELAYELKISCTIAMLMCLEKEDRMIFLFSSLLNLKSNVASEILGLSPDLFRKRLSRAKKKLMNFIDENCGLVNPDNPCKCKQRVNYALLQGRISPNQKYYSSVDFVENETSLSKKILEMEELEDMGTIFKNNPSYKMPSEILNKVIEIAKN